MTSAQDRLEEAVRELLAYGFTSLEIESMVGYVATCYASPYEAPYDDHLYNGGEGDYPLY